MKKIISILILGTVFLGGCCSCLCGNGPKTDAEGFTYLDGRHVAADAPSDSPQTSAETMMFFIEETFSRDEWI